VKAIDASARIEPANEVPGIDQLNGGLKALAVAFDPEWGGFGKAPKFPSTFHLELMLRSYMTSAGDGPRTIITTTLDAMASGGMYDHIGGGFARYSTDREWLVPHFEKMLYDQGLLVGTYLRALIVTGLPQYRQVVEETIEYVLRELRHPDGGFAALAVVLIDCAEGEAVLLGDAHGAPLEFMPLPYSFETPAA